MLLVSLLVIVPEILITTSPSATATERLSFTTRRMMHDPATGLAIYGIDPLSYFISDAPLPGDEKIETVKFGVIWRFASESNRAAFESDPAVYSPRYGGYDGFRMLEGFLAEGNPTIYEIDTDKLVFFASELNRQSWLKAKDDRIEQAERNWLRLRQRLPR